MKKFNRREKLFIRLMILTVAVALALNLHKRYTNYKVDLQANIESIEEQIDALEERIGEEDKDRYLAQAKNLEGDLAKARESILHLPSEAEASLLIREAISEKADQAAVTINSISKRKSKAINEEEKLQELQVYFVYDSDLEPLLKFFEQINNQNYFLTIETLSIQVRRSFSRRKNIKKNPRRRQLTGNVTLAALFKPNSDGSLESYGSGRKRSAALDPSSSTKPGDQKSTAVDMNAKIAAAEIKEGDKVPNLLGVDAKRVNPDPTKTARGPIQAVQPKTNPNTGQKPKWQPKPKRLSDSSKLKKSKKPNFSP